MNLSLTTLLNQAWLSQLGLVLVFSALFACTKDKDAVGPDQGQVIFWTADPQVSDYKVDCYVDDKLIGSLKKSSEGTPNCRASGFPVAVVSPGVHTYEVKINGMTSFGDQLDTESGRCYDVELY